jgi:hypothetical protein
MKYRMIAARDPRAAEDQMNKLTEAGWVYKDLSISNHDIVVVMEKDTL